MLRCVGAVDQLSFCIHGGISKNTMDRIELTQTIEHALQTYEAGQTAELRVARERILELETEIAAVHQVLEQQGDIMDRLQDDELRERLQDLKNARFDTRLREAGVILENRLRGMVGPNGHGQTGARLVDLAFAPNVGVLQVSDVTGEQVGLQSLYRGAIQFIRNPPMHKLIEYPEQTAYTLLTMIDALLVLLDEVTSVEQSPEEKTAKPHVRFTVDMLRETIATARNRQAAERFSRILDWTLFNKLYVQSTGVNPSFGISGRTGKRMVTVKVNGSAYLCLLPGRFATPADRQNLFEAYQSLGLIQRFEQLDEINDGRFSQRLLSELSDEEFDMFMEVLDTYFNPPASD